MGKLISVIIATRNRGVSLRETLQTLARQVMNGNFDYEVLVVDNNSTDNTKEMIGGLMPLFQNRLQYLFESRRGKCHALNTGIKNARGDILAVTDDDVLVDPGWLMALLRCFFNCDCDAVAGRVLPVFPEGTALWIRDNPTKMAGGVVIYDYGTQTNEFGQDQQRFLASNVAFKKEVFDVCGLFRTDLGPGTGAAGEDDEFFQRLRARGMKMIYCGAAVIRHPVDPQRLTLRHMARWHLALGRGHAKFESADKSREFVYWAGVPRYLFRGAARDFFKLIFNIFNKLAFFNSWRSFFRNLGMIQEYRKIAKQKDKVQHA